MSAVGKDDRGFSLLELVLVLLVLSISMLLVVPNINKGLDDRRVRGSALGLAAAARDLRSRALMDGIPQQLIVDSSQNSYSIGRIQEIHLPADVKFVSVEGGESADPGRKRFYFFPNGSSLGGEIVLGDSGETTSYHVQVEPLTGRVQVSRGKAS